ncbi:MAG: glycosyltransferase [Betaproteobacteria bacterium]
MLETPQTAKGAVRVALLTSFPPRRCGIATFSRDLCAAWEESAAVQARIIAIDEIDRGYEYPPVVRWRLADRCQADYREVAASVGQSDTDVVVLQHEYGLFGGPAGEMVLTFLAEVPRPVVTILHTVMSDPTPDVADVTRRICASSAAIVVGGPRSATVLVERYGVADDTIVVIPHGVPDTGPEPSRDGQAPELAPIAMSFGFIGPNKGLENAIAALPMVVHQVPGLRYRIVGTQHPGELHRAGDTYRRGLERLADELGVASHVEFIDRFVTDAELSELLAGAAVCLLPYCDPEQSVSGTMARALGAGRALIASTFRHALDIADRGAVHLVPMRNPSAIASALSTVLTDREYRRLLERRALAVAATMRWSVVADTYARLLRHVTCDRVRP